jgi:sugar phosphate isomerase/epimerase
MNLSLVSKVLQDRSPEDVIDVAARTGYDGVEWFCLPQHLPPDTPPHTAKTLAARLQDHNLRVPCLSTYAGGFADLDDPQSAVQLDDFRRYLDLSHLFDCPLLRLWPDNMGRTLREPVSNSTLERVASFIRRAAEDAAHHGKRVAVEMHQTIGADSHLLTTLLQLVYRPNLGTIYDPCNLYLARRPHRLSDDPHLQTVASAGKIFHVQLKDGDLTIPTPPHYQDEPALRHGGSFDLLLGEGRVDLAGCLRDLQAARYDDWLSVETHALPRPNLDSAQIAAREIVSLRSLLSA